jgi:hypothetical protein
MIYTRPGTKPKSPPLAPFLLYVMLAVPVGLIGYVLGVLPLK